MHHFDFSVVNLYMTNDYETVSNFTQCPICPEYMHGDDFNSVW